MEFLGVGPLEFFVIAIVALLVIGPSKLPDLARQVGRASRSFRQAAQEFQHEMRREMDEEQEKRKQIEPSEIKGKD